MKIHQIEARFHVMHPKKVADWALQRANRNSCLGKRDAATGEELLPNPPKDQTPD